MGNVCGCLKIAENADLLICEATFMSELKEKAQEVKHMSTHDAANIANRANVKQLIITHFSQRYNSTSEIEQNAKELFANTRAAHDFMRARV